MKNVLKIPVLVLNKFWSPVHCTTVEKAIVDLSIGKVTAIDSESYCAYPWHNPESGMSWIDLPIVGEQLFIMATRGRKIRVPRIVVTSEYDKIPSFDVKFNMKNVWLRDGGRCQYSGKKLSLSEATKDHVIPTSRGGKDDWLNVVTCSEDMNKKKANRTPEEMGWKLLGKPHKPKWTPLYSAIFSNPEMPEDWKPFIKIRESHANLQSAMKS